jgi:hypothetical protein
MKELKYFNIIIRVLWGVIAAIWIGITFYNLNASLPLQQSAMQASQLYNEATTTLLGIIAITLLVNFTSFFDNTNSQEIQKQVERLSESEQRISETLNRIEQHFGNNEPTKINIPPFPSEISQKAAADTIVDEPPNTVSNAPLCPKCHIPMEIRKATQGEHQGELFYVCSNFPNCDQVIPIKK